MNLFCRATYGKKTTWSVKLVNGPFLCLWKTLIYSSLKVHPNCVAFGPNMCGGTKTWLVKLINGPFLCL